MSNLRVDAAFATCAGLLPRVESAYLDCVSDDLALLLAAHGVADVLTPFAVDWRFDLIESPDVLPRLDLPPSDQDDLLARRTGWRPQWRPNVSLGHDLAAWHAALCKGSPVVLVGDAFHLPWLPYHRREHMSHGFVLEGLEPADASPIAHVIDPYDNATQWGRATPLTTQLSLDGLAAGLADGRWAVLERTGPAVPMEPALAVMRNAGAIVAAAERGDYRRFIERHRPAGLTELENLTLQCWLLVRNRFLHARWLADLPARALDPTLAGRFVHRVANPWQRVSEMSYLALRRVRSGRRAPSAVMSALQSAADAELLLAQELLASSVSTAGTGEGRNTP